MRIATTTTHRHTLFISNRHGDLRTVYLLNPWSHRTEHHPHSLSALWVQYVGLYSTQYSEKTSLLQHTLDSPPKKGLQKGSLAVPI